jgi:DNA-binding transcriptional LysR family regulator
MDRITSMAVFGKVVEAGSFSAAARQLRLSQAAVSKHVQALESWLGAPLLNRTTRRLSLTDFGAAFHERSMRLLEDVEEARQVAGEWRTVPKGRLRVTAPVSFARHLEPMVADFVAHYPEVALHIDLVDRRIDLIEEGCDVALRVGHLPDSSLVARQLAVSPYFVCATPNYLSEQGEPHHPPELADRACLQFAHHTHGQWRFACEGTELAVPVRGPLVSNNADLLLEAALAGRGLILAPSFHVGREIAAGLLVPVLSPFMTATSVMHAVYPQTRHLSAKVRCFIDCLVPWFRSSPWTMDAADPGSFRAS